MNTEAVLIHKPTFGASLQRFWRNTKYFLKISLDGSYFFWSMAYPIILAVLFTVAFSGLKDQSFSPVKVGVAPNAVFRTYMNEIPVLKLVDVSPADKLKALSSGEIAAYVNDDLSIQATKEDAQTDVVYQVVNGIDQGMALGPAARHLDFNKDLIATNNQPITVFTRLYYAIIGMVSIYSYFSAIWFSAIMMANQGPLPMRNNIVPLGKTSFLLSGFIIAMIMNLFANMVLIGAITVISGEVVIHNWGASLLILFMANLFGVALGFLIGSFHRLPEGAKVGLGIAIAMFLSFFAGLFSTNVDQILHAIPWFNDYNPVAIVTDNLYQINLMSMDFGLQKGVLVLLGWTVLLGGASWLMLRRKQYESL